MENQNSGNKLLISLGVSLLVLAILAGLVAIGEILGKAKKSKKESISKTEIILISQYEMKKNYGWQDIILWAESKENFEKAYNTKLNWLNYAMGFQRDPMCISPIGGDGEWQYDKICFNFVIRLDLPNMLYEIAAKTKNKTLVVIGSIHDNNQRFSGNVYWCE